MIKNCLICEKEFKSDAWSLKNRACLYCSRKCSDIGRKTGENRKCLVCSKEFYIIPAHIKRRKTNGTYCSRDCMYKCPIRNAKFAGENNYNWKGGGKNLLRTRFRDQVKKTVFERDNYTCQLCGDRGVELHVDHIQPWAEYIELRFKIDNCRTLCVPCHYKITFGKPMPASVKTWGHSRRHKFI